ncbi:MAG TPA: response regulator transcription factor [Bacillota bacterium]|nr:response regulator transcription factor [Bacillota bacterium]
MIRLIIVDDSPLVREGLQMLLSNKEDIEVIGQAASGNDAVELCRTLTPDLVVMDIKMAGGDGIEATRKIKEMNRAIKVLILSTFNIHHYITKAIQMGADGYILKDASEENIIAAIKGVYSGLNVAQDDVFQRVKQTWAVEQLDVEKNKYRDFVGRLTEREKDIVRLLVNSHTNKEIADVLGITEGTVKNIISNIIVKHRLKDKVQLIHYSIKGNLV